MEKNKKQKIPPHLEKYLPKYVILYGEPYLILNEKNEYELKMSIPITDYFLRTFQEYYKLKNKPEPQEMFDLLKDDVENFMKKLKNNEKSLTN